VELSARVDVFEAKNFVPLLEIKAQLSSNYSPSFQIANNKDINDYFSV
jgi:hypothetical protein